MNLNLSFAEEFLLSNSTCRNLNNLLSLNKIKFISTLLTFTLSKIVEVIVLCIFLFSRATVQTRKCCIALDLIQLCTHRRTI